MIQEINGVIRNRKSKQLHNAMVTKNNTKRQIMVHKTPHVQLQTTTRTTTKHHTYNYKNGRKD